MKKLLTILLILITANTFAQRTFVIKGNGYSNRQVDSINNLKLNISDTVSMLSPYAKNNALALKVNIADTSSMLTPYLRKIDSTIANRVTVNTANITSNTTALAGKAPLISPTFSTSITGSYLTSSQLLGTDASKNIVSLSTSTYPSLTELSYVKGVTSSLQTQINSKGTFTLPALSSGSVLFSNETTIAQDNSNFFWDNTNHRLGIGTTSPVYPLDIETGSIKINNGITGAGSSGTIYLGDGTFTKSYGSGWSFTGGLSATGAVTVGTALAVGTTINGQTISNVANFVGSLAVALNVGIGTTSPNAKLESLSTTEQLRTSYDATHYASFTVNSSGDLTIGGTTGKITATSFNLKASADLTGQTAAGNITTYTVGAADASYDISGYINVTAISVDVLQFQVTYTDVSNTARTVTVGANVSATGDYSFDLKEVRVKASTTITVKTNQLTGGGSETFYAGGTITKIR